MIIITMSMSDMFHLQLSSISSRFVHNNYIIIIYI